MHPFRVTAKVPCLPT